MLGLMVFCAMISGVSATSVEDHGTIYVKEHQTFNITLTDWGDCGYGPWKVKSIDNSQIKFVGQANNVDLDGRFGKGVCGYFGYDILNFIAIKSGKTTIYLDTKQAWGKNSDIIAKYTVVVIPN